MKEIPIVYKIEIEQEWSDIDLDIEDQGMAMIYHVESPHIPSLFVRVQSWDDEKTHSLFNEAIRGRKLKITIETID